MHVERQHNVRMPEEELAPHRRHAEESDLLRVGRHSDECIIESRNRRLRGSLRWNDTQIGDLVIVAHNRPLEME